MHYRIKASILSIAAIFILMQSAHSEPEALNACRVLKVNHSAWLTREGSSIKRTVKVGDIITETDVVQVQKGHYIQLAFDKDNDNVIHVNGNARFTVSTGKIVEINLEAGEIFALIDNNKLIHKFQVQTPTAISGVRGTYLQVNAKGQRTETLVFRGGVRMYGKTDSGRAMLGSSYLYPGEFSVVNRAGKLPSEPRTMSRKDFNAIQSVLQKFEKTRITPSYEAAVKDIEVRLNKITGTENSFSDVDKRTLEDVKRGFDVSDYLTETKDLATQKAKKGNVVY